MTKSDPPEYGALPFEERRFRRELLQEVSKLRMDALLHLRNMDGGMSIFRGEANAYQRTFVAAMTGTRCLLRVLILLHILMIALLIYLVMELP